MMRMMRMMSDVVSRSTVQRVICAVRIVLSFSSLRDSTQQIVRRDHHHHHRYHQSTYDRLFADAVDADDAFAVQCTPRSPMNAQTMTRMMTMTLKICDRTAGVWHPSCDGMSE